jgi:hypothetical protein
VLSFYIKNELINVAQLIKGLHEYRILWRDSDHALIGARFFYEQGVTKIEHQGGVVPNKKVQESELLALGIAGQEFSKEIAVHALLTLQRTGRVMLPVDYWGSRAAQDVSSVDKRDGHSGVLLLERVPNTICQVRLVLFETNGLMTWKVKADAVQKKRTINGILKKSTLLSVSDFTLADVSGRYDDATIGNPYAFSRIESRVELTSISDVAAPPHLIGHLLIKDAVNLAKIIGNDYFFKNGTLQEVSNTLEHVIRS